MNAALPGPRYYVSIRCGVVSVAECQTTPEGAFRVGRVLWQHVLREPQRWLTGRWLIETWFERRPLFREPLPWLNVTVSPILMEDSDDAGIIDLAPEAHS